MIFLPSLSHTSTTQDSTMREVLERFSRGEEIEEHHLQSFVAIIEDLKKKIAE